MARSSATASRAATIDTIGRDRFNRIALAFVLLGAGLTYANALANGFVLDDGPMIRENPLVHSTDGLWRAFGLPYWPESIGAGQYRPLGIISYTIDWLVSGGDPRWFHFVNVLWHVAATAAVWALAAELLSPMGAVIAALLFGVHPVHVEAVANIVGRLECMAALFVLVSMIAHRRKSRWTPAFFALAMLSKENAIVFLALAAAHDLLLTPDRRAAFRERRWLYAGYAVVIVLYATLFFAVFHDRAVTTPSRSLIGLDMIERLPVIASIIPHYIRLLLLPAELSASYAPNVIPLRPGIVGVVLGLALVTILVTALVATARERRWPAMAFALVWIPIALAPVANVFFPSVLLAERTLYLPSVGACLALGAVAERVVFTRPRVVVAVMATIVIGFVARTWTRTPVWRDDRVFVLTMYKQRPESYEAHLTAGRILKGAGRYAEAARELELARQLFPRDPNVYTELADLAQRQGRQALAAVMRDSARIAPTFPLPSR